jgi:hypothetical protein
VFPVLESLRITLITQSIVCSTLFRYTPTRATTPRAAPSTSSLPVPPSFYPHCLETGHDARLGRASTLLPSTIPKGEKGACLLRGLCVIPGLVRPLSGVVATPSILRWLGTPMALHLGVTILNWLKTPGKGFGMYQGT